MKLLCNYIPFQLLIGIIIGLLMPVESKFNMLFIGLLSTCILVLTLIAYLSKHTLVWLFCTITLGILSGLFLKIYKYESQNHFVNNEPKEVVFIVHEKMNTKSKIKRYLAHVKYIDQKKVALKVLLYDTTDSLEVGGRYVTVTRFHSLSQLITPYHFNYRRYLNHKGIFCKAYINEVHFIGKDKSWFYKIKQFKNRLLDQLQNSKFSEATKEVVSTMILGDKSMLGEETKRSFGRAGVMHLMAISGMHVGVLYLIFQWMFSFLNASRNVIFLQVLLILIGLWLFAIFTGLSSSVLRATTMFSIFTISKLIRGNRSSFESIVISALILLLCNPNLIYDVGFQMSYAAVISIVAFYPIVTRRVKVKHKIIKYFLDVLWISLIAQLGVLPLSIYYFHQFPTQFLLSNLFAVSLLPIVLYGGLVHLCLMSVSEYNYIMMIYDKFIVIYVSVIKQFSKLNGLIENILIHRKEVLFYYVLILLGFILIKHFKKKYLAITLFIIIAFQCCFLMYREKNNDELLLWNDRKGVISITDNHQLYLFSKDTLTNSLLKPLALNFHIDSIQYHQERSFSYHHKSYLIIDEKLPYHQLHQSFDYLLIKDIQGINFERILLQLKPKKIFILPSCKPWFIDKIKKTCSNMKTPFYMVNTRGVFVQKNSY